MPDYGARYTDKEINRVERELHGVYQQAKEELEDKLDEFYQKHKARDRMKRKQLADGKITRQEYQDWMNGQIFQREQWKRQIKQINHILYDTNSQAVKIVNERRLDVFAENYNYFAYLGEQNPGISFELYDARSVARLIHEHPRILPEWKIDEEKDYIWNAKKVNNIVTQGIIQGEGIGEIAQRLSRDLSSQNENKMLMFARTAMTGAQNAGRQQCMEDTANMGVDTHKKWVATLDRRTRDSHRHLDGQEVPYNEDFESDHGAIKYPGDPEADPAEVFNCRCTMVTIFPKYEDRKKRDWREDEMIEDQTYAEWKQGKKQQDIAIEDIKKHPNISDLWGGLGIETKAKDAIIDWADGRAYDIRYAQQNGIETEETQIIEKLIAESKEHYGGNLYRGIMADDNFIEMLKRLSDEENEEDEEEIMLLDMKGTSSWTTDESVADKFSKNADKIGGLDIEGKTTPVIFHANVGSESNLAVDVDGIIGYGQSEVIVSKKAKFVPVYVSEDDGAWTVYLDLYEE